MTTAKTHKRPPVKREIRTAKASNADRAIGELSRGMEVFVLTYGQFSLIDAVATLVRKTGPADVYLSTWTAGHEDLTTAANLLDGSEITRLRMVVDRSFVTRQPGYCRRMLSLFGSDCIRTWRGHAKFAVIKNAEWTLAVRTSMNLNTNPRLETIEVSDDPALAAFLTDIVDELFIEQPADVFNGELPELASIPTVDPGQIQMGKASAAPTPQTTMRI
jgi:hypothetical protein